MNLKRSYERYRYCPYSLNHGARRFMLGYRANFPAADQGVCIRWLCPDSHCFVAVNAEDKLAFVHATYSLPARRDQRNHHVIYSHHIMIIHTSHIQIHSSVCLSSPSPSSHRSRGHSHHTHIHTSCIIPQYIRSSMHFPWSILGPRGVFHIQLSAQLFYPGFLHPSSGCHNVGKL